MAVEKILIIPDGHRRYLESSGIRHIDAYNIGGEVAIQLIKGIRDNTSISFVSLFILTSYNFNDRSTENLKAIFFSISNFCQSIIKNNIPGISFRIRGSLSRLPKSVKSDLLALASEYNYPRKLTVELLIDYDGLEEIKTLGIPRILNQYRQYDLVFRTGGNFRLSRAPLLECYDSDMIVINKNFPELTFKDLEENIIRYENDLKRRNDLRKN